MNSRSTGRLAKFVALIWILAMVWALGHASQRTNALSLASTAAPTAQIPSSDYWPTTDWQTSSPPEQGMDAGSLTAMLDVAKDPALNLHSLLIIRHGYLVSETYFGYYDKNTRHEIYSCTKSFISTLVGIAIDLGLIDSVDHPILDFFPGRTFANLDDQKRRMTLEDFLTMRTGLDWSEDDIPSMYQSRDWVKFVLDKPMKTQPGSQFNYCTGCTHVLSAILQQKTGMKTEDFAQKVLLEPLGIINYSWDTDPAGVSYGGWGLFLTPREMAKLGYLYLHNGQWDGKQIVSTDWVKTATTMHTSTDSEIGIGYGYQWWTYPSYGAYTALGLDGQTIFVIPTLDLIVVTTAQTTNNHDAIFNLIDKFIVPAFRET